LADVSIGSLQLRGGLQVRNTYFGSIILAFVALPLNAAITQPVRTDSGWVAGVPGRDQSVTAFKGIPFAAPPMGDMRWKAPAPPAAWKDVRKADSFGPSCIQTIVRERKPWTYEFMTHTEVSEDCLSLNVWTAAKSPNEKRPVYVYIYGGGFNEGSGAVPVYNGEGLAKKGIVVVTFNYRIGVLGFLAHPELTKESPYKASGNYGLLDQIAALRWIRNNIRAFGGDPARVTLGGQSAGGMSVHSLISSPLAKGLFHRAIVESGGSSIGGAGISLGSRRLSDAEMDGQNFMGARGAKSLAELRAMSWQKLTEPEQNTPSSGRSGGMPMLRFAPIVDGYCLPAAAQRVIAEGKQNDVPVLTGQNEGELGGLMGPQGRASADSFARQARQRYGNMADEFLKLYPASSDEAAETAQAQSSRDLSLVSMYLWARERAKTSKKKAFIYLWDHALPGPDAERYGAFHTGEVPYVMNTLYMSDRPFTGTDGKIANIMSSYWVNFMATGDPNGKGLKTWPAVGTRPEVMELGDRTGPVPAASDPARFVFFEKFLTQR
jgi:para-nitrobenzyl esterase